MPLNALLATQQAVVEAGDDLELVLKAVVEGALDVMPQASGAVVEMRDGDDMVYRAGSGAAALQTGLRLSIHASLSGQSVLTGEALTCSDTETDDRVAREACRKIGVRSMIIVPLPHRGKIVGAFKIYSAVPHAFNEREMLAAKLLAGPIAVGLSSVAEAAAEHARDDAEAASEAKASFLANMSHEIRTPLNGMIGFSDLLLSADLGPTERRYASIIAESANALLGVLNDILDFSKIEADKLEIVDEPFNLPHVLGQCGELISSTAKSHGLEFNVDFSANLPTFIQGDALRIRQVILNLLGNAAKFTLSGSITLRAHVVGERNEQPLLEIAVVDTGIGIQPSKLEKLFGRFAQADANVSGRFGGSGLGLSISKRLAELMGGQVMLESTPGRGTTARLVIPLRVAEVEATKSEVVACIPEVKPSRILLVEDFDLNRELAVTILTRLGHDIETACDGLEALQRLSGRDEQPYDLILMDVHMPNMGGHEATKAIRDLPGWGAHIPIVALTASALPEDVSQCLESGMNGHVAKPITQQRLAAGINKWLCADDSRSPRLSAPELSDGLRLRFARRKEEMLGRLRHLGLGSECELCNAKKGEVAEICHQLAGVCGIFGESQLGRLALTVERLAKAQSCDFSKLRCAARDLMSALEYSSQ